MDIFSLFSRSLRKKMTRFLTIWRGGAPFIHGRQMRCLSSRWPPLKKEFAGGKSMTGDELFTKQAIELSKMAVKHGNEPFGALLVKDGKVVCTNENQIYTKHDPTFHGEAGLIREFCAQTGINDLHEYTMYASCEPCFMCSGAWYGQNWGGLSMRQAILTWSIFLAMRAVFRRGRHFAHLTRFQFFSAVSVRQQTSAPGPWRPLFH